jgi:hypothetical protein
MDGAVHSVRHTSAWLLVYLCITDFFHAYMCMRMSYGATFIVSNSSRLLILDFICVLLHVNYELN